VSNDCLWPYAGVRASTVRDFAREGQKSRRLERPCGRVSSSASVRLPPRVLQTTRKSVRALPALLSDERRHLQVTRTRKCASASSNFLTCGKTPCVDGANLGPVHSVFRAGHYWMSRRWTHRGLTQTIGAGLRAAPSATASLRKGFPLGNLANRRDRSRTRWPVGQTSVGQRGTDSNSELSFRSANQLRRQLRRQIRDRSILPASRHDGNVTRKDIFFADGVGLNWRRRNPDSGTKNKRGQLPGRI
jgi:hypothetical protein